MSFSEGEVSFAKDDNLECKLEMNAEKTLEEGHEKIECEDIIDKTKEEIAILLEKQECKELLKTKNTENLSSKFQNNSSMSNENNISKVTKSDEQRETKNKGKSQVLEVDLKQIDTEELKIEKVQIECDKTLEGRANILLGINETLSEKTHIEKDETKMDKISQISKVNTDQISNKVQTDNMLEPKSTKTQQNEIQIDLKKMQIETDKSQIDKNKIHKKTQQKIRAYTESQLSAFYKNTELEAVKNFTYEFIEAEMRGVANKQHPLYELLNNYLHARSKITGNNLEIEQLKKEYKESLLSLWNLNSTVTSARGECLDRNKVMAYESYTKATFNRALFQTVSRILSTMRQLVNETHTLYSYSAEVLRLKIESYIQNIIKSCTDITRVNKTSPVSLFMEELPQHYLMYITDLRLAISVLFLFQRRLIRDVVFVKKSREWLGRLVGVLLRIANWQDHLFVLNHVLR